MYTAMDAMTNEHLFEGTKESAILYAIRYCHAWEGERSAVVIDNATGEVVYGA